MEVKVSEKIPWVNCELQSDWLYLCNSDWSYSGSNIIGWFYIFLVIFFILFITTWYFGIYKWFKKSKILFYVLLSILILFSIVYYFKDMIAPWIYA